MYTSGMNLEGLKSLYRSKPAAKPIFDYFASYQTNVYEVTVDELQSVLQKKRYLIARKDITDLFNDLEKLDCGKFMVGRRTKKSRFQSRISLTSIGKATVDNELKPEKFTGNGEKLDNSWKFEGSTEDSTDEEGFEAEKTVETSHEDSEKYLTHIYVLRPNLTVTLRLPMDLTNSEADRLSAYIKTLPFST
jgi:hypothetical protein